VPILLGSVIVYSGAAGAGRVYAVIFVVAAFSVVAQGGTVPAVARRLKIPASYRELRRSRSGRETLTAADLPACP